MSFNRLSRLPLIAFFLALAASTACSSEDGSGESDRAVITSFRVESGVLAPGESTTLHWSTKNAKTVVLLENGVEVEEEKLPFKGEREVAPRSDSTYRLEASGADGVRVAKEVTVKVEVEGTPTIVSFASSPAEVSPGEKASLSWKVEGAVSVRISEEGGEVLAEDLDPDEGSIEVEPTKSTTYVLEAENALGVSTEELKVIVAMQPILSFESSADEVNFGEEVTLNWTVEGATSFVIRDPTGEPVYEGTGDSGSFTFRPKVSGDYEAVATSSVGEASSRVTLKVFPVVATLTAELPGDTRIFPTAWIRWKVEGADWMSLSNGVESVELQEGAGQIEMKVAPGREFRLSASNGLAITEETVVLSSLGGAPLILSLQAASRVTAGKGRTATTRIHWEVEGATSLSMEVDSDGPVDLSGKSTSSDGVDVTFSGPGTIFFTASTATADVVLEMPSPVEPTPSVDTFIAAPSRAGIGETVELRWQTSDANSVKLGMNGLEQGVDPGLIQGGVETGVIGVEATFVLRAFNSLGFEVTSEDLHVDVGSPDILLFETRSAERIFPVGSTVELVWENHGGTELTLRDTTSGVVVHTERDPFKIRSGSFFVPLPDVQGGKTYALEVVNASGTDSDSIDLYAFSGPLITSFSADPKEITMGDSVLLSWVARPDMVGNIPELDLKDQEEGDYPLGDVDPLGGSILVNPQTEGTTTFTLTATTQLPPAFEAHADVEVVPAPEILHLAASPEHASGEGDKVEVSWETKGAVSLEILAVGLDGQVDSILATLDPAMVQEGSIPFYPTQEFPDIRLVVENRLGATAMKDLRVGINPVEILHLTASEVDLLEGEELTLTWTVERSTQQTLGGFLDLRTRPRATQVSWPGSDETFVTVNFPSDFAFPLFGNPTPFQHIKVNDNGWASFDSTAPSQPTNTDLPGTTPNTAKIHVAPFWDDLILNASSPTGTVHWEVIDEGDERAFVLQWSNINRWGEGGSDLNFQAWLFESGAIEFRYGEMMASSPSVAAGSSATIGVQGWDGASSSMVSYNTPIPGGLAGRVYRFDPDLETFHELEAAPLPVASEGDWTFTPSRTRTYTLHAWDEDGSDAASVTVHVHARAKVSVELDPPEPSPGEEVSLHWQGESLTELVIEDEDRVELYRASEEELEAGQAPLGALAEGHHVFFIRAVGKVARDEIEEEIEVPVFGPFSIEKFEADRTQIDLDDSVSLSWETSNVTSAVIKDLMTDAVYEILPEDLDEGVILRSPKKSTVYVLEVESHGRKKQVEVTVSVRSVWFDDLAAPVAVLESDQGTLSWTTVGSGEVTIMEDLGLPIEPMVEVTSSSSFEDIRGTGVRLYPGTLGGTLILDVAFEDGFAFPFFGEVYDRLQLAATGYLSFGGGAAGWKKENTELPSLVEPDVHLPIFWGDIEGTGHGVYGKHVPGPNEHYIIQWSNFQLSQGPGDTGSFQVVLYRNGEIEYRYGVMEGALDSGDRVTIGIQKPGGEEGTQLHHGTKASPVSFPGGLSNRSWRWKPTALPPSGSIDVDPGRYTICVADGSWRECEEIFINRVSPGSLLITELMIDPLPDITYQWFELANASRGTIDLEGMVIRTGSLTHTITKGSPFLLAKGEVALFAWADVHPFTPDYIYDGFQDMSQAGTDISIEWNGVPIAKVDWDETWPIAKGRSIELGPTELRGDTASWTTSSIYTQGFTLYDGVNRGSPGFVGIFDTAEYRVDTFSTKPFIDISRTGTTVPQMAADEGRAGIPVPFSMPFFDGVVDTIWADANGWISFSPTQPPAANASPGSLPRGIGASPAGPLVTAFWDDLGCPQTSGRFTFQYEQRVVSGETVTILQWNNYKQCSHVGGITFQIQLWSSGDIVIAFDEIWSASATSSRHRYAGNTAWIGLEPWDPSDAVTVLHRRPQVFAGRSFAFEKK